MTRFDTINDFHIWLDKIVKRKIRIAVEKGYDHLLEADENGIIDIPGEYIIDISSNLEGALKAVDMLYNLMHIGCFDKELQEEMEFVLNGAVPLTEDLIIGLVVQICSDFADDYIKSRPKYYLSYWKKCVEELKK